VAAARDLVNLAFHQPFSGLVKLPVMLGFKPASDTIQGIASTYDPRNSDDPMTGGLEMASGERYDAEGWNAAIRVDLRDKFGGVNFGKYYRPAYALIESNDKRVIVKINDVGSLEPGRIIDLNVSTMRYFDPTLKLGLIYDVKVIPLLGTDMPLGPVKRDPPRNFAGWFT
jgi:peptidoglycan lytic transglycosylase